MFLGRSRKPVNLGSRKQSSASDVLRNAERQRSKREGQRRELKAAQTVQAAVRARNTLMQGRLDLAQWLLSSEFATVGAEWLAYIVPVLFRLPKADQKTLLYKFVGSDDSQQFSGLLVQRLPLIWNQRPVDDALSKLGFGILRHQDPPHVPPGVFSSLLELNSISPIPETLGWTAERDPRELLIVLLSTTDTKVITTLPSDALQPLFKLTSIPVAPEQPALRELITMVAPRSSEAWPLLSALVAAVDPLAGKFKDLEVVLCKREFVQTIAIHDSPLNAAKYVSKLIDLFPHSRPDILLHLLLATSPSPLHTFWDAYKATQEESILYIVVILFSYWLLVATDAELLTNASIGLRYEDLMGLATVVRDKSFDILWRKEPNKQHVLNDYEGDLLKLLRQLYTRDSRRQLFAPGFWLLEDLIMGQSYQVSHTADKGMFDAMVADEEDDQADADDDISTSRLVLKPTRSLRILQFAPFFVGFETRVALFYRGIESERENRRYFYGPPIHFGVNRETLREDSQTLFQELGPRVKNNLRVQFISGGTPEPGVDGGGLMKELLTKLATNVFKEEPKSDPCPLFVETANHTLAPNPIYGEDLKLFTEEVGKRYFFYGQIIGKCLFENLLFDVEFASFFLAKWNVASAAHSVRSTFDDLYLLDSELYNNMAKLHSIHGDDVVALGLDFTTVGSQGQEIQLRPNGSQIPVTDANKLEYIREIANFKLNTSLRPQTVRFLQGVSQIIRLEWLTMFNPKEINKLISGGTHDVDIDDLRRHTEVSGFDGHDDTVENFWQVLRELTPEQQGKFLRFVTSAPKGPLLGFDKLDPHFGVRCAGADDTRLPTSSTCVNLLKLPAYSSIETLREKLIYAIESGAGFDLS